MSLPHRLSTPPLDDEVNGESATERAARSLIDHVHGIGARVIAAAGLRVARQIPAADQSIRRPPTARDLAASEAPYSRFSSFATEVDGLPVDRDQTCLPRLHCGR